jgi:putative oxidoreductase
MFAVVSPQFSLAMLILRVAVGAMIAIHGVSHVWKNGKSTINGTAGWFGSMGMRPPLVQAWLASIAEIGSGVLLVLGLFTPLGAAGLFGVMLVAWIIAHRKNGFFIYNKDQGWEYVAVVSAIALTIGTVGPGEYSLDDAFGIEWWTQWRGLATVLIAGGGGAIALLAACWRPVRPASS